MWRSSRQAATAAKKLGRPEFALGGIDAEAQWGAKSWGGGAQPHCSNLMA
jgi:hypothetical protein